MSGSSRENAAMPTDDCAAQLEVDLETFAAAHAEGAVVLDVRNPDEYEAGHVPGAKLIPLPELASRQEEIPDGDPVYVICATGGRSLVATKAMAEAGWRALSVAGGTKGWIEQGRPYVSGPSER
jgi:rhodanese-related sulfurtransferase